MNNKKGLIILILAFALLIGGAAILYDRLSADAPSQQIAVENEPGQVEQGAETEDKELTAAPDFTVFTADGQMVKLSELAGKPVVLNFWASWCPPCKSEMPDFEEAFIQYGEDIHFMMVNATDGVQDTVEKASEYIARQGYTFPVYYDTAMEASYTYGVSSLPTTFFIDSEGYLTAYAMGALDKDTLLKGIGMITE